MMRIQNESQWIRRHLTRTWSVASKIIIFDDRSTDNTEEECITSLRDSQLVNITWDHYKITCVMTHNSALYLIKSNHKNLDEVRDKNILWKYASSLKPKYCLCLDGDEMLSLESIRNWSKALDELDGGLHGLILPFIYLWNSEDTQRVDGVYRDIWHGRLFTTQWTPNYNKLIFRNRGYPGGFHCGSTPDGIVCQVRANLPVLHFGYLDKALRQKKYEFYTQIDANNMAEGGYLHIIEEKNHLCPDQVILKEYHDV